MQFEQIKVDKGVPVPPAPRRAAYPVDSMDVGDSFFVPVEKHASVRALTCTKRWRDVGQFTVRLVDGGARCWRIS